MKLTEQPTDRLAGIFGVCVREFTRIKFEEDQPWVTWLSCRCVMWVGRFIHTCVGFSCYMWIILWKYWCNLEHDIEFEIIKIACTITDLLNELESTLIN